MLKITKDLAKIIFESNLCATKTQNGFRIDDQEFEIVEGENQIDKDALRFMFANGKFPYIKVRKNTNAVLSCTYISGLAGGTTDAPEHIQITVLKSNGDQKEKWYALKEITNEILI